MNALFSHTVRYLIQGAYPRFFLTGATGAVVNIGVTWVLTEYFFGRDSYFYAYLFGLFANIAYNFAMHTFLTFKTEGGHAKRFLLFFLYSLVATYLQAVTVKTLVPIFGVDRYIYVIVGTILAYSTVNFFVLRSAIFKK